MAMTPAFAGQNLSSWGCNREPKYPDLIGAETNAELMKAHGCLEVFDLRQKDREYKALVFKLPKAGENDSDYRVIFYAKSNGTYRRHGAQHNLVNFERPSLRSGSEPSRPAAS